MRKRAERALLASEQLARRGQVNALKSALEALAMEPDPNQLVTHILRTLTAQFGAHSASVWRRGQADGKVRIEFAFEDDRVVPRTDPRFAGLDLMLPMEDIWPGPTSFVPANPASSKTSGPCRRSPCAIGCCWPSSPPPSAAKH